MGFEVCNRIIRGGRLDIEVPDIEAKKMVSDMNVDEFPVRIRCFFGGKSFSLDLVDRKRGFRLIGENLEKNGFEQEDSLGLDWDSTSKSMTIKILKKTAFVDMNYSNWVQVSPSYRICPKKFVVLREESPQSEESLLNRLLVCLPPDKVVRGKKRNLQYCSRCGLIISYEASVFHEGQLFCEQCAKVSDTQKAHHSQVPAPLPSKPDQIDPLSAARCQIYASCQNKKAAEGMMGPICHPIQKNEIASLNAFGELDRPKQFSTLKERLHYLQKVHEDVAVMTNGDVLGDKIPDEQEYQLRRFCYEMLKLGLTPGAGRNLHFPGSHPVSLDRENLQLLRQRYYYATWKADGTRYMLLLCLDGCYLVDRSFSFRRVQMRFPCKNTTELHHFTLLDGEMIIDNVSPQKQERRYLIFDLIAINRVSIVERPFYERWKMIEREVVEPRNQERRMMDAPVRGPYRYELEPFRVRRKDFWLLSTVGKLLKEFIPNLSHDADGLIFQGWDDPYVARTHEGLLKWKYPEMNSVDFLFEIGADGSEHLYLHDRGKKRLMDGNRVAFGDGVDPSSYSGKIIECSWDQEENVWVCMRVRTDKNTPNEFNTYRKVMKSIRDNITEETLLNEIGEIIRLPMYADRIQMDSRAQKKGKPQPTIRKDMR